ncbi:MAG: tRNA pseudouridine(55) synthase TruB, partial [Nocardioides sp.]
VVAQIRRLAGTRKVGHAGTLDPMATGVLVLGVGRATRLLGHLMLTEKAYAATIRLGETRTTDDAEGEVTGGSSAAAVTDAQIDQALEAFRGEIDQVPTAVSAIKVDGQRAYARVRAGEEVTLAARRVTVFSLTRHAIRRAGEFVDVDISLRCSSGTYVRAIARDLGAALGAGGHLTALRRTAVGPFAEAQARTLDELGEKFESTSLEAAARAAFAVVDLDADEATAVGFGRPIDRELAGLTALFAPDGAFLALYEPTEPGAVRARPVAVFV